jgi:hypothetical protein
MGSLKMLMEKEDSIVYEWTLAMGECGLSILLNQFKLKVVEMTQPSSLYPTKPSNEGNEVDNTLDEQDD